MLLSLYMTAYPAVEPYNATCTRARALSVASATHVSRPHDARKLGRRSSGQRALDCMCSGGAFATSTLLDIKDFVIRP